MIKELILSLVLAVSAHAETYYVLIPYSLENDAGIIKIAPATQLEVVDKNKHTFKIDGTGGIISVPWEYTTKDETAAKEALKKYQEELDREHTRQFKELIEYQKNKEQPAQ